MFQLPGSGMLWRSLTGGGTALPRTLPTMSGTIPPNVGEVATYPTPQRPRMAVDEVLQQVWPQPWYGSGDLDPITGDAPENRAMYLALYKKEPRLNAAIEGKIASIATMKFRWKASDENNLQDVEAAQFMEDTIRLSNHGGTRGLIANIMRAGQVYGWSAGEIKLREIEQGRWKGRWGLEHVRNLNTEPFIKLQLDVYRNITGIVNLIRGIQDYDPKKFVFYVNKPIFGNPFGQSDVQPAQRATMLFREVYQVWYIALKRYGLPYMHGKVGNPNYRKALENAMDDLQGSGWAVTSKEDEIVVLNLAAAAAANGFEAMIDKVSEDTFFAVRGASTPSQVSSNKGSDVRGSSKDSKDTGQDPIEMLAAEEVCISINRYLAPAIMGHNYPPTVGIPHLQIGDADEEDAKTRLDIIDIIENKLGRPCSSEEIYEIGNVNPADPKNPDDAKRIQSIQQQQQPAAPGMPPGAGPAPGGGAGDEPGSSPGGSSPAVPKPSQPGGAGTQMSQPVTGPDAVGNTQGMDGKGESEPVPPELIAAMLQAQIEGHPAAADAIADLGSDPEALQEFLADRDAGTQGMTSARMFSAFAATRSSGGWETSKELVKAVKKALKTVKTGPDYQRLFWNPQTKTAWWVSADGDEDDDVNKIKAALAAIDGVDEVRAEAEYWPKDKPGEPCNFECIFDLNDATKENNGRFSARCFGWYADPSPRSPSRATNSDTGQHRYGEAARRALAWQGREDKGEEHPKTTKDLLVAKKAEAEPVRAAARQAYAQAIANPGQVRPEDLKSLADHLHTLTRDEVRSHLAQVQRKSQGRLKQDLVDALLNHVRDTAIEHHEAKLDPMKMDLDQDIAQRNIEDLKGTSLPQKRSRDQDKEAAHAKANSHETRKAQRHELIKAGTQGELKAPEKVSHGTPDVGSILKDENRKFPDKTKSDPEEAQSRTAQDEYRDEVKAEADAKKGSDSGPSVKGAASAPTGWVGDNLLLINHAYKHLRDTDPAYANMTLDQFKDQLIRDHIKGTVSLSRADLPQALDANDVRESHTQHPAMKGQYGGDFHFLRTQRDPAKGIIHWAGIEHRNREQMK